MSQSSSQSSPESGGSKDDSRSGSPDGPLAHHLGLICLATPTPTPTPQEEAYLALVKETMPEFLPEAETVKFCEVCLQNVYHFASSCPYFDRIPPEVGDHVGPQYDIACVECGGSKDEHESQVGKGWIGRAIRKNCRYCPFPDHWGKDCPKRPADFEHMDLSSDSQDDEDNVEARARAEAGINLDVVDSDEDSEDYD